MAVWSTFSCHWLKHCFSYDSMALAKAMYLAFTYNTTRYIARPGLVYCVHHTTLVKNSCIAVDLQQGLQSSAVSWRWLCWWRRIGEVGQEIMWSRAVSPAGFLVSWSMLMRGAAVMYNTAGTEFKTCCWCCTSCPVSPCSSSASTSCSFCMVCFTRAKRERLHLMEPATGGMFLVSGGASYNKA